MTQTFLYVRLGDKVMVFVPLCSFPPKGQKTPPPWHLVCVSDGHVEKGKPLDDQLLSTQI